MTTGRSHIRVDHPEGYPDTRGAVARILGAILPAANPDFESAYSNVAYWYLEIEDSKPMREVGFDSEGKPIVIGPHGRNWGLWTDSPITLEASEYPTVSPAEFESAWAIASETAAKG